MRRRPADRQPVLQLLEQSRHREHGEGHLPELRQLLLSLRPAGRFRQGGALRQTAGHGAGIRPARDEPVLRHSPRSGLEAGEIRPFVGAVRYRQLIHRPGLLSRQSTTAGGDVRSPCDQQTRRTAPPDGHEKARLRKRRVQFRRPDQGPSGDERRGQRTGHCRTGAPPAGRRADGRQDRDRAGRLAQRVRRAIRPVEIPRPRIVRFLRPARQAEICRRGRHRTWRRFGLCLPDCARCHDVPVRSRKRDGRSQGLRRAVGRHGAGTSRSQIRHLRTGGRRAGRTDRGTQ